MTIDDEILNSLGEIIRFTGIPRRTFYGAGYANKLRNSGYIFSRRGRYGQVRYWSYKRLIMAWLAENFSQIPKKDEIAHS